MSIEQNSSTPPIDQSASQIGSCRSNLGLHDNSESLRQTAIAYMTQAEAALHQWRRSLEAEGVRYGAIHTYPHEERHGTTFILANPINTGRSAAATCPSKACPTTEPRFDGDRSASKFRLWRLKLEDSCKLPRGLHEPPPSQTSTICSDPPRSTPCPAPIPVNFATQIQQEFIAGSAIAPDLYSVATRLVGDTEVLPGGEVSYPIHEALNWKLTRFGYQARETQQAALLINEDGSTWQAKLSHPRLNRIKGTAQKYETPVGSDRAYLPPIPPSIRQAIAQRYGVDVPLFGSFWNWLEQHPQIPIVFTEGGKKALCLLSLGYVAIALYGINGGYRVRDPDKNVVSPYLLADVGQFAGLGRPTILVFDQDTKPDTRSTVARALSRFGGLLTAAGCEVTIAQWQPEQGKGVDDLCVQSGANAVHGAITNALPLPHWQIWQRLTQRLTYPANLKLTTADLSTLELELPEEGILAIASAKGTGKTKQIRTVAASAPKVLAAGHRIALMRNLCDRLNLDYRGDLDKAKGQFINGAGYALRIGFCVDSLLAINPQQFAGCDLIIDEVVQVIRHLLTSSTCAKDGRRPALLTRFHQLIQTARRVIVADADLDNGTLHYLQELRGRRYTRCF